MANGVYHTGLGIDLNLTEPDLGHPEFPGLWDTLRADERHVPERQLQCLRCRETRPDCPEWMFLTERDGIRFASHFTKGIADHPTPESDQHKAFKDRIVGAAEHGGFKVATEDRSEDGKRRTDVLVRGDDGVAIGWEVQLSWASLESVRQRAALARRDGITPLWASVDATRDFIDRVPWALLPDMPWYRIKDHRQLLVRGGVRRLGFYRCVWSSPLPCPAKGRGRCNQLHGTWESADKVLLEHLVEGSAAGEYVAIILPGKRVRRWWVKPADRDKYADSVGGLPAEDDLTRHRKPAAASVMDPKEIDPECRYGQDAGYRSPTAAVRDDGSVVVSAATFPAPRVEPPPPRMPVVPGLCRALASLDDLSRLCGRQARLYPCGWRCDELHRPQGVA